MLTWIGYKSINSQEFSVQSGQEISMLLTSTPLSDQPPSIKLVLGADQNTKLNYIYTNADGGILNKTFAITNLTSSDEMRRFKLITKDDKIEFFKMKDNSKVFEMTLEERDMFFMNSLGLYGYGEWIFHNDNLPSPPTTAPTTAPTATNPASTTKPSTTPMPVYAPDQGKIQLQTKSSLYTSMSMVSEAFVASVMSCNETELILSRFAKSTERDVVKINFGKNFIKVECQNCREKNKTHTESEILSCSKPFTFWVKFEKSVKITIGRASTIDSDRLIDLEGNLPYSLEGIELRSEELANWKFEQSSGKEKN